MSDSVGSGLKFKANYTFVAGLTWDKILSLLLNSFVTLGKSIISMSLRLTHLRSGEIIINTFHDCYQVECKMELIPPTWNGYCKDDNAA